jgi:general secretion pathway protein E
MTAQQNGIILVTGPTGSGKTTTLYSTLKLLAEPEVNVCTVEDPIEMIEPSFNQMQVQPTIGVDFRTACARCLRQGSRTSSWSAKSAIWRPPRWRSRRR